MFPEGIGFLTGLSGSTEFGLKERKAHSRWMEQNAKYTQVKIRVECVEATVDGIVESYCQVINSKLAGWSRVNR